MVEGDARWAKRRSSLDVRRLRTRRRGSGRQLRPRLSTGPGLRLFHTAGVSGQESRRTRSRDLTIDGTLHRRCSRRELWRGAIFPTGEPRQAHRPPHGSRRPIDWFSFHRSDPPPAYDVEISDALSSQCPLWVEGGHSANGSFGWKANIQTLF